MRYLVALTLALCPVLDAGAQCYRDADGNLVCTRPTLRGGTVTRVRSTPRVEVTYDAPTYTTYQTQRYTTYERRGLFGRRLVAVTRYRTVPVAAPVAAPGAQESPEAAPQAAASECDCGCADRLQDLEQRVKRLEAARYTDGLGRAKAGPPFSWQAQEGPAFVWTRPAQPQTMVAMR